MKYILIAFTLISCNNIDFNRDPAVSDKPLDTIQSASPKIIAFPRLFENAFIKGTTEQGKDATVSFYGVNIGKLKIPTGSLIACDPMHIDEYGIPFTQQFPTGEFPVQLAVARLKDEERIAFARINFSDEPVVRWEFALKEGNKPLPITSEEGPGYSVDASVGVFIDAAASKALNLDHVTRMDTGIYTELDKNYRHTWRYAMFNFGNHNLATFTSGFGDGFYSSYIGYDADGKPCRLLTDFGLFEWRDR